MRPRERVVPGLLGGRQGHFQGKIGLIYGAIHDASEIGTENRESLRMQPLFRRRPSLIDCVSPGRDFSATKIVPCFDTLGTNILDYLSRIFGCLVARLLLMH